MRFGLSRDYLCLNPGGPIGWRVASWILWPMCCTTESAVRETERRMICAAAGAGRRASVAAPGMISMISSRLARVVVSGIQPTGVPHVRLDSAQPTMLTISFSAGQLFGRIVQLGQAAAECTFRRYPALHGRWLACHDPPSES